MNQPHNRDADDTLKLDGMMDISDKEFRLLSDMIYKEFGIHLTEAKRSLLVRRLQSLLKNLGFRTFQDYYEYLSRNPSDDKFSELVNRITTNYTFFNREPDHFEFFKSTTLPWLKARAVTENSRDLRVWCAAASTGEEPYMLSMCMMEFFGDSYKLWDAGVLATDISERALAKAKAGRYPADEFDRMPIGLRHKYFRELPGGDFEVIPKLRNDITYRRFNLINKQYPFRKPFDVIFIRNVMIYFDDPTKDFVLSKLHECLAPGGFLFIGHSESIMHRKTHFKYIKPAVYRKIG